MTLHKLVIHTDIFLDYLLHRNGTESVLRKATASHFCYTTVFNAIELFSLARNERERRLIENALSAMKILGLSAKSAKKHGRWVANGMRLPRMNALIAGLCLESGLPILTGQPNEFRGVKGLVIMPVSKLSDGEVRALSGGRPV